MPDPNETTETVVETQETVTPSTEVVETIAPEKVETAATETTETTPAPETASGTVTDSFTLPETLAIDLKDFAAPTEQEAREIEFNMNKQVVDMLHTSPAMKAMLNYIQTGDATQLTPFVSQRDAMSEAKNDLEGFYKTHIKSEMKDRTESQLQADWEDWSRGNESWEDLTARQISDMNGFIAKAQESMARPETNVKFQVTPEQQKEINADIEKLQNWGSDIVGTQLIVEEGVSYTIPKENIEQTKALFDAFQKGHELFRNPKTGQPTTTMLKLIANGINAQKGFSHLIAAAKAKAVTEYIADSANIQKPNKGGSSKLPPAITAANTQEELLKQGAQNIMDSLK